MSTGQLVINGQFADKPLTVSQVTDWSPHKLLNSLTYFM